MRRGRVAQLGERLVRNEEAEGSNPFSSTNYLTTHQQYTRLPHEARQRNTRDVPVWFPPCDQSWRQLTNHQIFRFSDKEPQDFSFLPDRRYLRSSFFVCHLDPPVIVVPE